MQILIFLTVLLTASFPFTTNAAETPPQNVSDLWDNYDPRKEPLKCEIIKEWNKGEWQFQLLRYSLGKLQGTNKTAEPMIAAYYGYPKGKTNLPAVVQRHGGGQRASLQRVEAWVKLGYACISINWGAKVIDKKTRSILIGMVSRQVFFVLGL